ncbi:MAG: hypothetical protein IKO83_04905 [Oscillospiraceae bacterium]|nr:hypothetical protein [Oscillospiraceae bacterium]
MDYGTYSRIYIAAINKGHPDTDKTLKAFQRRCGVVREALREAKRQYDADLAEVDDLLANFHTTSAKASKKKMDLRDEYDGLVAVAKKKCLDDLEAVVAAKRAEFSKRNGAPTEEQLRLLQVLSMRSELTAGEIANVAYRLSDNIPAVRLLREIAQKHGIPFTDVGNDEDFERNLSAAEDFCRRMIDGIEKTDLDSREHGFYNRPELSTAADYYFGSLDNSIFTTPQKTAVEKPNAVAVYLNGSESLAALSMQFGVDSAAIRAANPDYDFSAMKRGDTIIVPSGKMKLADATGFVGEDQVSPARID